MQKIHEDPKGLQHHQEAFILVCPTFELLHHLLVQLALDQIHLHLSQVIEQPVQCHHALHLVS